MRTSTGWSGLLQTVCRMPAKRFAQLGDLLRRAAMAAAEHDVPTLAQAVAYSAMAALFPALIVAAAAVGMLPADLPFRNQFGVFFTRVLPSNVLPILEGYFAVTHKTQTIGALLGSLAVGLLGATSVMSTLMEGFRRAHDLPLLPGSFLLRRRRALALVPLSLLPMVAASALVVFGNKLTHSMARDMPRELQPTFSLLADLLRWASALAGATALIGMIYHLGTDLSLDVRSRLEPWVRDPLRILRRDWTWRRSLPGAVLATLLWFVATLLFGAYVTRFADYGRVYGSLGAAIALMAWLYIIALCILVGAEFNAQIARPNRDRESHAALWRLPGLPWRGSGRA